MRVHRHAARGRASRPPHVSRPPCSRRGSALVPALIAVLILSMTAAMSLSINSAVNSEQERGRDQMVALYMAEAGLSRAYVAVAGALERGEAVPGTVGSEGAPITTRSGSFWSDGTDNAGGTYTLLSRGRCGNSVRAIEALVRPMPETMPFQAGLFAGNSSGDPNYVMNFGGLGNQADDIDGDIYSGGSIDIAGDATVFGALSANGTITGGLGSEGVEMAPPDVAAMNYEVNHDVDVAAEFSSSGTWQTNPAGGSGLQVPEANPAHIFRKHPDDRSAEISSTQKDDYFLEDPYENVSLNNYRITLAPGGNGRVYFVDGNLWVHNYNSRGFRLHSPPGVDFLATIVVKGNIYFSDNIKYKDRNRDAIAFVAIEDDTVDDSGNIYFGASGFGALERMEAFMYAQNDFIDYNLNASVLAKVTVKGTMAAGNHVAITRDYDAGGGVIEHAKLKLDFDDRLAAGDVALPGIPGTAGRVSYRLAYWREASVD